MKLPIIQKQQTIGHFSLYYERAQDKNNTGSIALVKGLSQLFSQQYALSEAERQGHLVNQAEIKSLQAQMNPHFLFNILNAVKSLIRSNQEEASP
ncbi:histidine kinase [Paenibacillus filicis]|uniref:Histidine kinase n=1 Tax=Paenibacillus gyeongsangnamensis TaxID=3388067 RepID=A0ABT4Q1Y9_9BACL|nr:histidine kinase [Paenibacillus filicis]MCZ8510903.1 histidine kinase [Paenibacillus filicis]